MQPDYNTLLENAGIELAPIGLYDAPDDTPFEPLVGPGNKRWACVFMFFKPWQRGKTLHLTRQNYGCGGAGTYLFDKATRSREEYVDFLYGEEGLKETRQLMGSWIDQTPHYRPQHPHLLLGPLRAEQYEFLRTVTFFVNPDQLSLLLLGAHYREAPGDPPAVIAPFGAACGLLCPAFDDLEKPQAVIGATDIAARKYLPREILALTVTRPMFEQLSTLSPKSFLNKRFWQDLQKVRKRQGQQ